MVSTQDFISAIQMQNYNVVEQYVQEQRQLAVEEALKVLPAVVHSLVLNTARITSLKEEFFRGNQDLLEKRDYFAKTLEEIEARNPGKDYPELMKEAAEVTRERLKALQQSSERLSQKPTLEELDHLTGMFEEKK